jgi:sulfoxide reductase catalytic subunit YedY
MDKHKFKSIPIKPSEITPEHVYLSRRQFLKSLGILGAGALLASCSPSASQSQTQSQPTQPAAPLTVPQTGATTDELGDALTPFESITNFNNYYEFSTDKESVAQLAKGFIPNKGGGEIPWEVQVYGLVDKPQTFGLEDILKKFTQEERIYRLRCVEAWSMVIPWNGFPLAALLKEVGPTSQAKYVRFETVHDSTQMPGLRNRMYPWPYQEGLRMDEAMNDLAILATGLYGNALPPQDGSPLRLVVPWKYGFKSIKSIVKIELVDYQPETLWSTVLPNEYGFYANVNPEVNHPRWSQASERRIGESGRRETLMFNGYTEQVAGPYAGMDLSQNY